MVAANKAAVLEHVKHVLCEGNAQKASANFIAATAPYFKDGFYEKEDAKNLLVLLSALLGFNFSNINETANSLTLSVSRNIILALTDDEKIKDFSPWKDGSQLKSAFSRAENIRNKGERKDVRKINKETYKKHEEKGAEFIKKKLLPDYEDHRFFLQKENGELLSVVGLLDSVNDNESIARFHDAVKSSRLIFTP